MTLVSALAELRGAAADETHAFRNAPGLRFLLADVFTRNDVGDASACVFASGEDSRARLKRQVANVVELQRTLSAPPQQAIQASGKSRGFPVDAKLRAASNSSTWRVASSLH